MTAAKEHRCRSLIACFLFQGSACLTFQQVKNLVNLTYGISVRQSMGHSRHSRAYSSHSGRRSTSFSERSASRTSRRQSTPQPEGGDARSVADGEPQPAGKSGITRRTSTAQTDRRSKFHLEDVVEEEVLLANLSQEDLVPGQAPAERGVDECDEEEVKFTEDDELFAAGLLQHKGDPYKIFKLIEADGDGELDSHELKRAAERVLKVSLTNEEAKDMFADADWDGGGSISATEFCLYLGMPSGGKRAKLAELAEERVRLVSCCYNRLADEQERARELLLLLQDEVERNEAQRRLGLSAQTFCLHNPTGVLRAAAASC